MQRFTRPFEARDVNFSPDTVRREHPNSKRYAERVASVAPVRPHFDIRQAARVAGQTAGTLAGFALTVIVLLVAHRATSCAMRVSAKMAQADPLCFASGEHLRQRAVAALLVGFFGCVASAFLQPVIGAEEVLSRRTHKMSLFGGSAFSLAVAFLFWGLAVVVELFLGNGEPGTVTVADLVVVGAFLLMPGFLGYPPLDIRLAFDSPERHHMAPDWRDLAMTFAPGYSLLVIAGIFRLVVGGSGFTSLALEHTWVFYSVLGLTGGLVIIDALALLLVSGYQHNQEVTTRFSAFWVGIHAALFGLLVVMLPG